MGYSKKQIRIGNQRLLKLADFLEKLPPHRFDYGTFVGEGWKGAKDLSCGTTACAIGWAATMPAFRRLGLGIVNIGLKNPLWDYYTQLPFKGKVVDKKTGRQDAEAGRRIFALTTNEADHLFYPNVWAQQEVASSPKEDASPKEVAKFIRLFVANRSK